jgi:hypothetical protein
MPTRLSHLPGHRCRDKRRGRKAACFSRSHRDNYDNASCGLSADRKRQQEQVGLEFKAARRDGANTLRHLFSDGIERGFDTFANVHTPIR